MKIITVVFISICLLTLSIMIILVEKTSSAVIPIANAGDDQIVNEGDVVQFNGNSSTGAGVVNVLHVSVYQNNELQMMIDKTGATENFSVTQVGLTGFNTGTPSDLSIYDAIVFGLNNGFEMHSDPIARTAELKDYISNGGGIVWTHDSLEYTYDYGPDLEKPAGVDCDLNYTHYIGLSIPDVEIIMDHEILHNLFEIGNVGDFIPKTPYPPPWYHYAHTDQSNVTTADIIIQHNTNPGSINFYLTTEEYGSGRVAVDVIGHTVISEDGVFLGIPSLKECQILVNAIYWVADGGNISNIVSYSWDFDANVDSDGDGNNTNDTDATGPTPTHIYGDDGFYTVTLTVTDDNGLSDTDTCIVTVDNVAPRIEPFGPFTVEEGSPIDINGIGTDPGSDDLSFSWSFEPGPTISNMYYNDGVGPDPYPSPWGTCPFTTIDTVTHTYDDTGVFTLSLTVEDDDGGVTLFSTNVTVISVSPPKLYINVSQNGKDVILYWDSSSLFGVDHYLLYRSTSQIGFDFDKIWVNTSSDNESGEPGPIPLRTVWNDTNAAFPGNITNYEEEYYYIIRAVNILGRVSCTSRTVGKWTKSFPQGVSSFSLPLEPLVTTTATADFFLNDMETRYIKWMNTTTHIWMKHGDGGDNNSLLEVGRGYEIAFDSPMNYTFIGMPGAQIRYMTYGIPGFDYNTTAKTLRITNIDETTGNVTIEWDEPPGMDPNGRYNVYYSTTRDGFDDGTAILLTWISASSPRIAVHPNAISSESQYYYMVAPLNETMVRGASTYSIGIWTENYSCGYDTLGIPIKLSTNQTADWYCDNIDNTVGINYFSASLKRWQWHSSRMCAGAFDPTLTMIEGYQISTLNTAKFSFIGV